MDYFFDRMLSDVRFVPTPKSTSFYHRNIGDISWNSFLRRVLQLVYVATYYNANP